MSPVAKRLAANVFMSWFANIAKVGVQLLMLPLMARLLGPEELGLYSLALPILSFVLLLSDGGLGNSLARESRDNERVWSSAFWGLIGSGAVLAVVVVIFSYFIGMVSQQPRLVLIMIPLSFTLLLVASSVIPAARLLQTGRQGFGALADMVGNLLGAGLGVWIALSGGGVWALVAQYLCSFVIRVTVFSFFEPYLPKFIFDFNALKSHFGVGGAITGGRLVDFAGRVIENSQISRSLGSAALGFYGFANQVPRFLCEAASNPIWSNLYYLTLNSDKSEISNHYIRHCRMIALVVFPAAGFVAVMAPQLVEIMMGPEWSQTVFTLAVLLVTYPMVTIGNQNGAVLYAQNFAKIPFWGSVALSVGRVGIVALTGFIGLNGVALALGALNVLYGIAMVVASSKGTYTHPLALAKSLIGPLMASAVACGLLYYALTFGTGLIWLILTGLGGGIVYLMALLIGDRRRFGEDLSMVMKLLKR